MKASALFVGMEYLPPLAFYGMMDPTAATLSKVRGEFTRLLANPNRSQTSFAAVQ